MKRLLLIPLVLFLACEDKQEKDCAGVEGGTAVLDECGVCDGDTTNDCTQDCENVWGGTVSFDSCGVCDGDNSSCSGCTHSLATNFNPDAMYDDGSCVFSDNVDITCYDGIDNDGDGLTDIEDSNCQGYLNGQNLTDLNNLVSEIIPLLGDRTCDNACNCNQVSLYSHPPLPSITYCESNINNDIIDSLFTIYGNLKSSIIESYPPEPPMDYPDTPLGYYTWILENGECVHSYIPYPPYLPAPHEYCLDCIDNDNDGLLDYDDLECPEDLIESCIMDTSSICPYFQDCEDHYNEYIQVCEDYLSYSLLLCPSSLDDCSNNCGNDYDCIEQCQDYFQSCTDGVEDIYQDCISSLEEIYQDCTTDIEMSYQECISQIEEICNNTYCTCDSTPNN